MDCRFYPQLEGNGLINSPPLQELLDQGRNVEDRQVKGDNHAPDHHTEEGDHQRFDHGGQLLGGRLDLLVIEIRDLVQHLLKGSGVLTHGDHLNNHVREHRFQRKRPANGMTLAH